MGMTIQFKRPDGHELQGYLAEPAQLGSDDSPYTIGKELAIVGGLAPF